MKPDFGGSVREGVQTGFSESLRGDGVDPPREVDDVDRQALILLLWLREPGGIHEGGGAGVRSLFLERLDAVHV